MIMNANSPASGEQTGLADAPVGLVQGMSVMSNVRSRPGGLVLPWDRSWYFQVPGEQNPQPAWVSSKPWSPLAHLRLLPICATLGTGRGVGPAWQPASTRTMATVASVLRGDGSGDGIRRHIVRDRVRVPVRALCLTNPNAA